MNILVFNCGSSSLTFKLYALGPGDRLEEILRGKGSRIGVKGDRPSSIEFRQAGRVSGGAARMDNHRQAAALVLDEIAARRLPVHAIGHRWPHSNGHFTTALIDEPLMRLLRELLPIIPIHHPASMRIILESRRRHPSIPQYVTTDMAFHATLPPEAYRYMLPRGLAEEHGFRKYGFHGLSFRYVTEKVRGELSPRRGGARLVICHLGTGGSEVAAVRDGLSVDVSMGYTGLPGLMMSTRCGDIDPLLPAWLSRTYDASFEEVSRLLNFQSGLLGVTEATSDIRDVLERCATEEGYRSRLALSMYVRSIRRYVGAFAAELRGVDTLVFTDDIGVKSPRIRSLVCAGMEWCGIRLDEERNGRATGEEEAHIEAPDSSMDILVVPTDEELVIAREGLGVIGGARACG